jgi:hypothetical protein
MEHIPLVVQQSVSLQEVSNFVGYHFLIFSIIECSTDEDSADITFDLSPCINGKQTKTVIIITIALFSSNDAPYISTNGFYPLHATIQLQEAFLLQKK